jgi:hypothetical protein
MKDYKTKEEIIIDLKNSLSESSPFDNYIRVRLDTPRDLIKEFKEKPTLALGNKRGDWFFVWKNQTTRINGDWVQIEDLLNKLSELL